MNSNKRAYYWIKLHTAYLSNYKFISQSSKTKYHYIALYLMACEGDSGGVLVQNEEVLSIEQMAFLLREEKDDLQESVDKLVEAGLMNIEDDGAYTISRFMDEQGKPSFGAEEDKKRKDWRDRQARHRNKLREVENADTNSDTNKDIESHGNFTEKSRVTSHEKEIIPYSSSFSSPSSRNNKDFIFNSCKRKLEERLHINTDNQKWADFIDFACEREEKHNEPIDKFISWFLKNNLDIIYFPPDKMKTLYPQAFVPEKPFCEPLPEIPDSGKYAPMPRSLINKRKKNFNN